MKVYTDGSCRNGVGGWAWWCPATQEWKNGYEVPSTNQRMELYAALDAINTFYDHKNLTIISDSAYLVNCFGERWWIKWIENGWINSRNKEILNRDIWEPLLEVVKGHGNIKFIWVRGHSGDEGNEMADTLATGAVLNAQREIKNGEGEANQGGAGTGVSRRRGENTGISSDGLAEKGPSGGAGSESGGEADRVRPVVEKTQVVGNHRCGYCGRKPHTHFLLMSSRSFLIACKMHAAQLRMPLLITEPFDEHPWGEYCNISGSGWILPIETTIQSWCTIGRNV